MRVAVNKLYADIVCNVMYIKAVALLLYTGMEYNLKHNVPKLFSEKHGIFCVDSLDHLIGLLNDILSYALVILFPVPRTADIRAKHLHNGDKIVKIVAFLIKQQLDLFLCRHFLLLYFI